MNAQKIAKFIWEELVAFLAWAAPTLWNMFAEYKWNRRWLSLYDLQWWHNRLWPRWDKEAANL